MRAPRGTLLMVAIGFAAALDYCVALRPNGDAFSEQVMGSARTEVRKIQKAGDLIIASPLFRMSELKALGDLPTSPHVPPPKLRATRRLVVIDRSDRPIYGLGDPAEVLEVPDSDGRLVVKIYEPEGALDVPLYSLRDSITGNTMHVERPSGNIASRCTTPRGEGGYSCPNEPDWLYVAKRTLRVGAEDVECVWAHPTTQGAIVLTIPAQAPPPAGRRLILELSGGFNDDAVRMTQDGAAVRGEVTQRGQPKGTLLTPNRVGWTRARLNIDPDAPIELRFTTPNDGRRHYCVNADIIEIDEGAK